MNHRIFKLLRLLGAPLLAAAAVFGSCTTELESNEFSPGGGNGKGEQEVLLKLHVPGTTKPGEKGGTRAVNKNEEDEIDDLYVLAFKAEADENKDAYEYWVSAKKGGDNATWTAALKVRDYNQRFIVIANALGANPNLANVIQGLKPGTLKSDIKQQLTVTLKDTEKTSGFNAKADNDHSAFTMCGQTKPTTIAAGGNINLQVSLYRIMARIQLYFGDKNGGGVANFTPSTVRLYNFNDKAQVIPAELDTKVTKTTIPADAKLQKGEAKYTVTGNKLEYSIYMFETAQPGDADQNKHVKRPCLVVGGKYNGGTADKYYRVDLGTPKAGTGNTELDYLDILRNHSYEITVTKVSGEGHDTEQEALESKSANMTATVIPWNETEIGNIDFDGEKFLGIGTMEYRVGKMGSDNLIQKVAASTGLEWRAALLNEDGQGIPNWIRFMVDGAEQTEATGTGADTPADLKFKVTEKKAQGDRVAIMRFTAGHLQVDARVIQDDNNPVFIDILDDVIEFDGATDADRSFNITFGPENTTLTWEVVDGNNPITFTAKSIDGSTEGNTGVQSGTTARKQVAANFTAQAIAGDETGKKTATLRLIAKNDNGDITAKSVRLSQIKRVVTLSKDLIITDGQEHNIYVDANFDWSVKMEKAGEIEGQFINSFDQTQSGEGSVGSSSTKSIIRFSTVLAQQWNLQKKSIELTFTDKRTGGTVKKNIEFVTGFYYNGHIYHVLDGGSKSLKVARENDRTLVDGKTAPQEYGLPEPALATKLAEASSTTVWTNDLAWRTTGWQNADVRSVSYNGTPGFTLVVGKTPNGSISTQMYVLVATATGTTNAAVDQVQLSVTNTGISYQWYPWLVVQNNNLSTLHFAGVGTDRVPYARQAVEVWDTTNPYGLKATPMQTLILGNNASAEINRVVGYESVQNGRTILYPYYWDFDNRDFRFRLSCITQANSLKETHKVYFVKQVW
ncbi:DUF4906 domain-containing protein [Bacteroides fragilis]|uniref:DUF4906 domain-containing protein n=1 Tax=Bacteroides fragilis TaxID=817 RepID=A0A396BQL2_BACFG|nr:DUF4906 domain-containing protein [Bacteroides fragilis]RHH05310.1 DUF4906 domain-containing protein [Bacteroides fragilis]